jgi:hypothetical protein
MAATRKTWVYSPSRPAKPSVPEATKADVAARARELVESELKPRHIGPPPDNEHLNYIVDIGTKWYRDYFYFFATYKVPGPTAITPSFEAKFARLQYHGANRFGLAFMRHTGQWAEPLPTFHWRNAWQRYEMTPSSCLNARGATA